MSTEKNWNTWGSSSFVPMQHIKAGLQIVPGAFSEAESAYSEFLFDDTLHLYEHDRDGRYCRLRCGHAHAEFELEYLKTDPWTLLVRMRNIVPPREWGLLFHMLVSIGYPEGQGEMYLSSDGALYGIGEEFHAAVAFLEEPYHIALAESHDAVGLQMADKGFKSNWRTPVQQAPWSTCRFTLEAGPEVCLSVSLATDPGSARERANAALKDFACWDSLRDGILAERPVSTSEEYPGMLEAISDIMGWNDMYSPALQRTYTSIAKAWNASFGDWYLFFSDACYQIFLNALSGDAEMAEQNLDFLLSASTPAGNFAGLYSGFQKWVDRSQPPVLGYNLLMSYYLTGNHSALDRAFPSLLRAAHWYMEHRGGTQSHLVRLGTSPTGSGDYRRTKVGAKNEAAMDNSPMYDEAVYDRASGLLDLQDVGISSLLALDMECAAKVGHLLGRHADAQWLEETSTAMRQAIHDQLWNEAEGIFANRHLDGRFGLTSPTSFYALAAGAADETQLDRCIAHIFNPEEFFTDCPLIAINAKDPSARENKYWRGRTWAPQTFWTYVGLRRGGRDQEAHALARAALKHFDRHWKGSRRAYENYNPFTGEGSDSVDSNGFYSWTALLPAMWVMEQLSLDPWNGLCFGFLDGAPCTQRNRMIWGQRCDLTCAEGLTTLSMNGRVVFRSNLPVRFRAVSLEDHYCAVTVETPVSGFVEFPGRQAVKTLLNGEDLSPACRVDLPAGAHTVELFCRSF